MRLYVFHVLYRSILLDFNVAGSLNGAAPSVSGLHIFWVNYGEKIASENMRHFTADFACCLTEWNGVQSGGEKKKERKKERAKGL